MKSNKIGQVAICLGLLVQTGCAHRLFFATKTSIGMEVSGTSQVPDKVSLSTSRYEGAIVPRSTNGEPYSVYGGLDADMKWFPPKYTIRQTFATGSAAQIAAEVEPSPECSCNGDKKPSSRQSPLFFVTDTSFGLKISAGKQDVSPTFLLGYKRVEGTIIPVDKSEAEVRSVYADIIINSTTNETGITSEFPNNGGVRIKQSFATGKAADAAAKKPEVKAALDSMATSSAAGTRTDAAIHDETIMSHVYTRLQAAAGAGNTRAKEHLDALNQLGSLVPDSYLQYDTPPPPNAQDLQSKAINIRGAKDYTTFVSYRRMLVSNANKLENELTKALPDARKLELKQFQKNVDADLKKLNDAARKSGAEIKAVRFYANNMA
jgi:hypothetical protein